MTTQERQAQIESAKSDLLIAKTSVERKRAWARLRALINSRTRLEILMMEHERGL